MITHITERESALTNILRITTEVLNHATAQRDVLKAEIDELRETLELARMKTYLVSISEIAAERDALKADAARYRLLRDSDWEMFKPEWLEQHDLFGEGPDQMDEEFDAIIAGVPV